MPAPKGTRKTSTTSTAVSSQPSLKASFAAVRNAKRAGVTGEKTKSQTVITPIAISPVVATPVPAATVAKEAPKKVSNDRDSITDWTSEEDDFEPVSPIVESGPEITEVKVHEEVVKPQLNVKDKSVNKHLGKVNEKTGYMPGIHTENETKFQKILRVFDLSYEYGPCVGITRLERWNRANDLGLEPPVEVRDILLTQEGKEELAENIFHRRV